MTSNRRSRDIDRLIASRAREVRDQLERADQTRLSGPLRRQAADRMRDRLVFVLILAAAASVATVVCAWSMR